MTKTTVNLEPTKAGYAHMRRIFTEEIKGARTNIADTDALLERLEGDVVAPRDYPLIEKALEAFSTREYERIAHFELGLAELDKVTP